MAHLPTVEVYMRRSVAGPVAHHEGVNIVASIEDRGAGAELRVVDRVPHAVVTLEDARVGEQQVHADTIGRDDVALDVGVAPPRAADVAAQRRALAVDRRADQLDFIVQLRKQDVCPVHSALHMHAGRQDG